MLAPTGPTTGPNPAVNCWAVRQPPEGETSCHEEKMARNPVGRTCNKPLQAEFSLDTFRSLAIDRVADKAGARAHTVKRKFNMTSLSPVSRCILGTRKQ